MDHHPNKTNKKKCTTCERTLEANTIFFHKKDYKRSRGKFGFASKCRECYNTKQRNELREKKAKKEALKK